MADNILEFVFVNKLLADKFIVKVRSYGVTTTLVKLYPLWEVHIPDTINEDIYCDLNDYYDEIVFNQ